MSLAVGRKKLHDALRTLRVRHTEARAEWDDQVARVFDSKYIDGLDTRIAAAVTAMERMQELVQQARRECS
ncbi:MAG: hypothetical protein KDA16_03550 [Phycisphaerales bacterium]|nr:hypothetical protein [Phycisphaerales bacterium]